MVGKLQMTKLWEVVSNYFGCVRMVMNSRTPEVREPTEDRIVLIVVEDG